MGKIYYLSVSLTTEGIKERITELEYSEKANSYIVNAQSNFGGKTTRLKKDDILKIDSMVMDGMVTPIQFYTWFLESQRTQAIINVYNAIRERATEQAEKANNLLTHLTNQP